MEKEERKYQRIMVVGNNGSGKSFLSKELAAVTGLPCIHLDKIYWKPHWQQPSKKEWISIQEKLMKAPQWIMDGNHHHTMEIRFKEAELIIFLNINIFLCLTSVFRRKGKKRDDMPEYLKEKFDLSFFKFCLRLLKFSKHGRKTIFTLHKKYPDKDFLMLNSRKEAGLLILAIKANNFDDKNT